MKTKFKISNRILSLALAVVMVLSCLPLSSLMASAAAYEGMEADATYDVTFDPNGGQFAQGILAKRMITDENGYLDQGWLDVMYTNFKRDGYSVSGYNTKPDGSGEAVTGSLCFTQDTTVYVMWQQDTVTIDDTITNGMVTADKTTAIEGETVTLTVTPAEGFELGTLTVKDADNGDVTVTDNTFTMPASNVTVTATFVEICDHSGNTNEHTDNGDGTHDLVCSVCQKVTVDNEAHTYDYASGKCGVCGVNMVAASLTTESETLYISIADMKDGYTLYEEGTLKLLQDITMETGCAILFDASATVDLNGHTLTAVGVWPLLVQSKAVTVQDTAGGGKLNGTMPQDGIVVTGVYLNGSTVKVKGNVTITGAYGSFYYISGTVDLREATAPESYSIYAGWNIRAPYDAVSLPKGYVLKNGDAVVGKTDTITTHNVLTVARCENHTGGTATCTAKAVCTLCGEEYGDLGDHSFDETGLCSCDTQAVAKVKVVNKRDGSSYVNFYTDFDDAFGEWSCTNGIETTMTLLANARYDGEYILEIAEGREILDLNGFTLDLGDKYFVYYGVKLTILGKEGSKITTTADYCLDGSEVYLSGTVQMVGKTASFYVADDDNWVIINFSSAPQVPYTVLKEEPGIFARPVEGVTLDPGKFTSAKAGYMVIKNAEGELELAECDHSGNTNTEYTSNDGTHSLTCNLCGGTAASGDHTGGTATCTQKAVCDVCQSEYGELSSHAIDSTTGKCGACGEYAAIATVVSGSTTLYASDAATLNQVVTAILESGSRTFTVNLPADTPVELFTAIRRAICDTEGVTDGSIDLTLAGVKAIPDHSVFATDDSGIIFGNSYDEEMETVTQLVSVSLPDALTVGSSAFNSCSNLTSLYAPKLQTVGSNAFAYTGLTSVNLPEATTVGLGAFSACMSLTSVKLPKATSIGNLAFLKGTILPESFDLELSAEGDITVGESVFSIPDQNYSEKVDLVLCCNKANEVTDGVTWNGYTFKSIRHTDHKWNDGKCTVCGHVCPHTGGTATCMGKKCTTCGTFYGTVDAGNHTYGTEWKSDGANHWHECTCGAKADEATHNGGTATCKDKAVCSTCDTAYGELAVHTYENGKCTVCKAADPNYKPPATDNPQTGDNSHMALWFALLFISGGALVTLTVVDRKRRTAR